jgi:hypothetical protein
MVQLGYKSMELSGSVYCLHYCTELPIIKENGGVDIEKITNELMREEIDG